jgi:hypothetical protein
VQSIRYGGESVSQSPLTYKLFFIPAWGTYGLGYQPKKIQALAYDRRSSAYEIETSQVKYLYGFTYHRLKPERSGLSPVQVAAQHVRLFDLGRPAEAMFAVQRCTICGARVCGLAHFVPKPIMHLFEMSIERMQVGLSVIDPRCNPVG